MFSYLFSATPCDSVSGFCFCSVAHTACFLSLSATCPIADAFLLEIPFQIRHRFFVTAPPSLDNGAKCFIEQSRKIL